MYIVMKPQITEYSKRTCPFHERHPSQQFPGCTCSSSLRSRDKPFEEWTPAEAEQYAAALQGERPDGTPLF